MGIVNSMSMLERVAPLSPRSYFLIVRQPGHDFSCPLRIRPRFRLGCLRGTTNTVQVINSSIRRVRRLSLLLITNKTGRTCSGRGYLDASVLRVAVRFRTSLFSDFVGGHRFGAVGSVFRGTSYNLIFDHRVVLHVRPRLGGLSDSGPSSFRGLLHLVRVLGALSLSRGTHGLGTVGAMRGFDGVSGSHLSAVVLFLRRGCRHPILLSRLTSLVGVDRTSLAQFLGG